MNRIELIHPNGFVQRLDNKLFDLTVSTAMKERDMETRHKTLQDLTSYFLASVRNAVLPQLPEGTEIAMVFDSKANTV